MAQLNIASGSSVVLGGTTYPVTNIKVSFKVDNTDTTDSGTAVGYKESIDGRSDVSFTFDGYKSSTVADVPTGNKLPCRLNFGTVYYTGSASVQSVDVDGDVITGVAKVSYAAKFHGAVSSSI